MGITSPWPPPGAWRHSAASKYSWVQQLWESPSPGFPWRLGSFRGIKIFLGCAAAVGNIFHAYCRCLFGAPLPRKKSRRTTGPVPHILGIYIPFNKCLFGYKNRGIFLEKKSKKKQKSHFFCQDHLRTPKRPPQHKAGSKQLDLQPGSSFFAGENTNQVHWDLLRPGVGKNWAQRTRYSIFLEIALMVGS